MTERQRQRIEKRLVARLTELYRSAHADVRAEMLGDGLAPDEPGDEGDESQRTLLRDTRMRMAEVDARRAQLLEEALRRLRQGSYGRCIDCGGPIEAKRLEAVPWALRCVECQEAAEFEARDRSPSL